MTTADPRQSTALQALSIIARHHGVDVGPQRLVHDYALGEGEAVADALLVRMADELGLKAKSARLDWADLAELGYAYPVIGRLINGNSVVISGFRNKEDDVVVIDPLAGQQGFLFIPKDKFLASWQGETVLIKRRYRMGDESQPFGLRWFIPEILRQSFAFGSVMVAAVCLMLLALVTPLFFQLVIDKVLVHQARTTLEVLGIGIGIALVFEAVLSFLRNYVLLHATNKIDIRLASRVFQHMTRLPLNFFETSSAGVLTKHMQQIDSIRRFLTGKLFFTVIDAFGLFVFIPLLLFYSGVLAGVVALFSVVVAAVIFAVMPAFRRQLQTLYEAEGRRQSLLVEAIHGMRTVKSLALEPTLGRRWEEASARAVTRQFEVGKISLTAQGVIGLVEKLLTVAIVWVGAELVFANRLTIGELIAFQMLAGRVSQPLVGIVSLINELPQTLLSVRMLGEIMNRRPERDLNADGMRPPLSGSIRIEDLTFRYPAAAVPALADIDMDIAPGSMIGIVGRSGSGKSTLLRLLQGLYLPQTGSIRFDGTDMRELDLAHLRHSVGIVLQENFIFRGTVRENIAITNPEAGFDEIIAAARTAGADEFIQSLPQGYETPLEENASNLSGGQKQRLAIARAILPQPPVLILDEATSALDPESEGIVQQNMAKIAKGRTVIVVSHRLASLVSSDVIYVLDKGRIVGAGPHRQLLRECPIYNQLWSRQNAHLLEPA